MIDLVSYRLRIVTFVGGNVRGGTNNNRKAQIADDISHFITGNCSVSKFVSVSFVYLYFMLCVLGLVMGMALDCNFRSSYSYDFSNISNMEMIHFHLSHVKILSSVLIAFLVTRDCITFRYLGCFSGLLAKAVRGRSTSGLKYSSRTLRAVAFIHKCILWLFLINAALVIIVNPSLLNPGPTQTLSIVSFNCQCLIPFSELGE